MTIAFRYSLFAYVTLQTGSGVKGKQVNTFKEAFQCQLCVGAVRPLQTTASTEIGGFARSLIVTSLHAKGGEQNMMVILLWLVR